MVDTSNYHILTRLLDGENHGLVNKENSNKVSLPNHGGRSNENHVKSDSGV